MVNLRVFTISRKNGKYYGGMVVEGNRVKRGPSGINSLAGKPLDVALYTLRKLGYIVTEQVEMGEQE